MKKFVWIILGFAVASLAAKRPDVMFILEDDLGWKDTGCCGSTFYDPLNVNRLAGSGMRLVEGKEVRLIVP